MNERGVFDRPTAGLSIFEWFELGSAHAKNKLTEIAPEINHRPPAGLSMADCAQLGLESAKKDILKILQTKV